MESTEIVVVGAGVVGLAIAAKISSRIPDIIVLERRDGFGRETSSRNSEVIHAGLYYPSDSLKASLCVKGNTALYELCSRVNIPFRKTGKIIVASTDQQREKIHKLHAQGTENGVEHLEFLSPEKAGEMEPNINCIEALWSPSTGILDTHRLMKYFETQCTSKGGIVSYNSSVRSISFTGSAWEIDVLDSDGSVWILSCKTVINAAGLYSDTIAASAGIDIDSAGYRLHPCKGEYFSVSNRHRNKLTHLVYPAPTPISLGIHAVLRLDGSLKLGPNAFYVDSLDYDVDRTHLDSFYRAAREYLPFIEKDDLAPDMSGIRPKRQAEGVPFADFAIREESDRGLPGLINLIGIESPGLTSCTAIADLVDTML